MNQTRLAKALGVSQQAVHAWLRGRALPEPERMAAIEEILGIPMRDWVEASETREPDSGRDVTSLDEESPLSPTAKAG